MNSKPGPSIKHVRAPDFTFVVTVRQCYEESCNKDLNEKSEAETKWLQSAEELEQEENTEKIRIAYIDIIKLLFSRNHLWVCTRTP